MYANLLAYIRMLDYHTYLQWFEANSFIFSEKYTNSTVKRKDQPLILIHDVTITGDDERKQ